MDETQLWIVQTLLKFVIDLLYKVAFVLPKEHWGWWRIRLRPFVLWIRHGLLPH